MQKPNGLVVIEQHDLPHILHSLDLRDLCGIGPAMEMRLNQQNIYSTEQLCAASNKRLIAFGAVLKAIGFTKNYAANL